MNREIMELYKKHRVNPLSGCLPMFIQMPIFIALFQVLSRSAELKGAPFLWIKDLAAPDALVRFPKPVPLVGESLNLLPILMAVGMFVQQRMTSTNSAGMSEEQKAQQKIFKWFPLVFSFLFYGLPSGLVLYWVVNTALTLSQYALFHRIQSKSS
jgi:YidC/Oxa1 family membrane protein insertase